MGLKVTYDKHKKGKLSFRQHLQNLKNTFPLKVTNCNKTAPAFFSLNFHIFEKKQTCNLKKGIIVKKKETKMGV